MRSTCATLANWGIPAAFRSPVRHLPAVDKGPFQVGGYEVGTPVGGLYKPLIA